MNVRRMRKRSSVHNGNNSRRDYLKRLREHRKAQGFCIQCDTPRVPNHHLCQAHLDILNARRAVHKEQGKCNQCASDASPGSCLCKPCYEKVLAKSKSRYDRLIANKKCCRCMAVHDTGRRLCGTCGELGRKANHDRRQERLAKGLCAFCGKFANLAGSTRCKRCFIRTLAHDHLGSTVHAEVLEQKFADCNEHCLFSGRKLFLGVNATLDHIIPVSRGGSLEAHNIRWIDKTVNQMKWNLLDSELLALIHQIAALHPQ